MQPLLASSYDGIELLLTVPPLVVVTVAGFICVLSRARIGALVCGIISVGIGAFSFWCGSHATKARQLDFGWGIAAVAVGALLYLYCWRARRI